MGRKHPKSLANLLSMDAEMKSTYSNIAANAYWDSKEVYIMSAMTRNYSYQELDVSAS